MYIILSDSELRLAKRVHSPRGGLVGLAEFGLGSFLYLPHRRDRLLLDPP